MPCNDQFDPETDYLIPQDGYQGEVDVYQESIQHIRGKKRARRAKGKKKKQKTSLMITNDDGTDSTTQVIASFILVIIVMKPNIPSSAFGGASRSSPTEESILEALKQPSAAGAQEFNPVHHRRPRELSALLELPARRGSGGAV